MRFSHFCAFVLLMTAATATAQDSVVQAGIPARQIPAATATDPDSPNPSPSVPTRWLLLCCGLPGDDGHRQRLTAACEKIIAAAEPMLGVSRQRMRLLVGDEEMRDAFADQAEGVSVCTKESVAQAIKGLCDQVESDDACWLMMLGHAHFYDGKSQFNVLGSDFDQSDFSAWAKPLACREQVFLITMPVSGFWIKPLSGASRVVISATEPDFEVTGTEMPYVLADLLAGDHEQQALEDIDRDGSLSLLDLYLAVNLEIHGRFSAMERLQTEHAQLDDNGDGRGSEVQLAYLPGVTSSEEPESADQAESTDQAKVTVPAMPTPPLPQPISNQNLDGYRARHILISPAKK